MKSGNKAKFFSPAALTLKVSIYSDFETRRDEGHFARTKKKGNFTSTYLYARLLFPNRKEIVSFVFDVFLIQYCNHCWIGSLSSWFVHYPFMSRKKKVPLEIVEIFPVLCTACFESHTRLVFWLGVLFTCCLIFHQVKIRVNGFEWPQEKIMARRRNERGDQWPSNFGTKPSRLELGS